MIACTLAEYMFKGRCSGLFCYHSLSSNSANSMYPGAKLKRLWLYKKRKNIDGLIKHGIL